MERKLKEPLRVLLVSREIDTVERICQSLQSASIHVETCCDRDAAMRRLCHSKFEGIIIDRLEEDLAVSLLREVRQLTSHKAVVAFALVNSDVQKTAAFQAGANFVLEHPLSSLRLTRAIRAAYSLMVRERRRYYRCPWETKVAVARLGRPELVATSINISETGIALTSPVVLDVGEPILVRFEIPQHGEAQIRADVCWADPSGRAGIQFREVRRQTAEALQQWLAIELSGVIPAYSKVEALPVPR